MMRRNLIKNGAGIALLTLGMVSLLSQTAKAQTPVGNAEGIKVSLLSLITIDLAKTSSLPASGAQQTAGAASASLISTGGYLSTGILSASTQGTPLNNVSAVSSTATVNGLDLFPVAFSTSLLTADTVTSTTTAGLSPFSSSGNTVITNLVFGGNSVNVTGAVNQTVSIAGVADLIINEQTLVGNVRTTNALHLTVLNGVNAGDVVVSHSVAGFSGISAAAPEPGAGILVLAFGPVLPAFAAFSARRRKRAGA